MLMSVVVLGLVRGRRKGRGEDIREDVSVWEELKDETKQKC